MSESPPRWLRIVKIALLVVVTVLILGAGGAFLLSNRALSADHGAPLHGISMPVPPPEDTAALAEGDRLATVFGCVDCHAADLGGKIFIDAPPFMVLPAPNLTTGRGGSPTIYDPDLFERAVRHGVGADGRNLIIMPSEKYNGMTDEELVLVLAHLRNVPPVSNAPGPMKIGPAGRMALAFGSGLIVSELADHRSPHVRDKEKGVSEAWGARYAKGCTSCHGPDYSGGVIPGAPEGTPPATNITPHADGLAGWTLEQFRTAMRTGVRPDGRQMNPAMPWPLLSRLTDEEIESVWLYIVELQPLPDPAG